MLAVKILIFIRGVNVDKLDELNRTPLIYATMYGHTDIVELLIGKDCNVNYVDIFGLTALTYASLYGLNDIVELLIRGGSIVNYGKCCIIL